MSNHPEMVRIYAAFHIAYMVDLERSWDWPHNRFKDKSVNEFGFATAVQSASCCNRAITALDDIAMP
jgi:hypothetical protein